MNCERCFGFGLFVSKTSGELTPVIAAEAHGTRPLPEDLRACPVCRSTEKGIPAERPNPEKRNS